MVPMCQACQEWKTSRSSVGEGKEALISMGKEGNWKSVPFRPWDVSFFLDRFKEGSKLFRVFQSAASPRRVPVNRRLDIWARK